MNFEAPKQSSPEKITLRLVEVSYDELPSEVVKKIEGRSSMFIHPREYSERNFDMFAKHVHDNGDISYFCEQYKTYSQGNTEQLTYIVDIRKSDENELRTGYLEIRYGLEDESGYFKDKPFVGITRTEEGFMRNGLARRRLIMANEYTMMKYKQPLYSDTLISDSAARVWERLVTEGLAEAVDEGAQRRFRFVLKQPEM